MPAPSRSASDGVLIRGPSGSGKSSLVLGLIAAIRRRRRLVADDRVAAFASNAAGSIAAAPAALAGKLEVRGQGIVDVAHVSPAAIDLVVDLLPPDGVPAHARTGRPRRSRSWASFCRG